MTPVNDRGVIALVLRKVPDTPSNLDKWRTVAQPYREKKDIKRSELTLRGVCPAVRRIDCGHGEMDFAFWI